MIAGKVGTLVLAATLWLAVAASAAGGAPAQHATFTNPVHDRDFPDPFVLQVGRTYYAYATNAGGQNIQTAVSRDLVHWSPGPDALPQLPAWASSGLTWAPSVLRRDDGTYSLYYTAHSVAANLQCIGQAASRSPLGPFVDGNPGPLVCPAGQGGAIDPYVLSDRGSAVYLYWKNNGNCCGLSSYIYGQRLAGDGTRLLGQPIRLKTNDVPWEGDFVEAPAMLRHGDRYFLFYSAGGGYDSPNYATGIASCDGPLGPCVDVSDHPALKTRCTAIGPGSNGFATDPNGDLWIVYHAWVGAVYTHRAMYIDRITWDQGQPVLHGPTCGPQQAP
jgi:beta-xylosidase